MYNIYEQNKRLLKRWWSRHHDVRLDIKKACTADLLPAKTNHVICSSSKTKTWRKTLREILSRI